MPAKAEINRSSINKAKAEKGEKIVTSSKAKTRIAINILFISLVSYNDT
ncbi:hypothetical protein [Chroococcidiopsis sp. TS-821]